MKNNISYILLLLAALLVYSCQFDEILVGYTDQNSNVEVLENGQIKLTTSLNGVSMTSVETRASSYEDVIYNGWCLVFGEDQLNLNKGEYSDESPLIYIEPVTANASGVFSILFDEYPNTAFMRIVVNLTDRENVTLTKIYNNDYAEGEIAYTSWRNVIAANKSNTAFEGSLDAPPTTQQVEDYHVVTFGMYRYQSVGLDGIYNMTYNTKATLTKFDEQYTDLSNSLTYYGVVYTTEGSNYYGTSNAGHAVLSGKNVESYNTTQPDPASPKTTGFPMASYGFVMDEITEESIKNLDEENSQIDMIRTCSKVQLKVNDNAFSISEIYVIDAAQESRIRSTVLSAVVEDNEGNPSVKTEFTVPQDLGGAITYLPLEENVTYCNTSSPIYFYPNKGGDYEYVSNLVNQDVNPQYIVFKGQSTNYDNPGYYKVALKVQYPLDGNNSTWSDLTYDILRNTSFTVNIDEIDKPGYLTFEDVADSNNPANNISYSITIETSDNRNEILVSKGTYYVELTGSRVYIKGYGDDGATGCKINFSLNPSSGNTTPNAYLRSSGGVTITGVTVNGVSKEVDAVSMYGDGIDSYTIEPSSADLAVELTFSAKSSGRLRIRSGDILKYIPVRVEEAQVVVENNLLSFVYEPETIFNYNSIVTEDEGLDEPTKVLGSDGYVSSHTIDYTRELRATLYTDSGITKLYFNQQAYDTDARYEGRNTIYLEDLDDDSPTMADSDDIDAFVDAVTSALITEKLTTVYIEGDYNSSLFSDGGYTTSSGEVIEDTNDKDDSKVRYYITVFQEIRAAIASAVDDGSLTYPNPYLYALDLSAIVRADGTSALVSPFAKISMYFFSRDTYLKALVLPSSVNWIGGGAFTGCSNLMTIDLGTDTDLADLATLDDNAFSGLPDGATITIYNQHNINGDLDVNTNVAYTMEELGGTTGETVGYKYVLTAV